MWKGIVGIGISILFLGIFLLFPYRVQAACFWHDPQELKQIAAEGSSAFYPGKKKLVQSANWAKKQPIPLITDKKIVPAGESPQDYRSLAIYYWPDESRPGGLPYKNHDGRINPEKDDTNRYDAKAMGRMIGMLRSLSLGYAVTGDKDYARYAAEILDAWFINPSTRMNPNLEHAQIVPGKHDGSKVGIIDSVALIEVADAVTLLADAGELTPKQQAGVKQWFSDYLDWLLQSAHGQAEARAENNHGVWYDAQTAVFAHFSGRDEDARRILRKVREQRMEPQFAADGSLPLELARTRPMQYTLYTLQAYLTLAALGDTLGINLYDVETANGSGIARGIDYVLPFVKGEKSMEKKDVMDYKKDVFVRMLHMANRHYKNPAYEITE